MLKQTRNKITYANVMSTVAAFLALGGGAAFAVDKINTGEIRRHAITRALIDRGAVGSKQIGKAVVGSKQIGRAAVESSELTKKAVAGRHIKRETIKGTHINAGTVLPVLTTIRTDEFTLAGETEAVINLGCNSDEVAISGGYEINSGGFGTTILASAPVATAVASPAIEWQLSLATPAAGTYTGSVTCLKTLSR